MKAQRLACQLDKVPGPLVLLLRVILGSGCHDPSIREREETSKEHRLSRKGSASSAFAVAVFLTLWWSCMYIVQVGYRKGQDMM